MTCDLSVLVLSPFAVVVCLVRMSAMFSNAFIEQLWEPRVDTNR